ncbi:adenylosuccinate synthase [Pediococcus claussenii]|nr:adenylosuccinate synthase [Pediococcus claussenii]ANZ70253.1 adenylosuccinate synthase [Pediococcus claussenii]ANZ72069.1 adenylosuccinate synthase [Pediococcus claussenii]
MSVSVVIGSQWGDEGKGKIIDLLGQSANFTVRYSGGDNAGHSLVVGNQHLALSLVPSGILNQDATCVLGNGVVINPKTLLDEITQLNDLGIKTEHLRISDRAHVILPYHILQDQQQERELSKLGKPIGTTNKGIGPAYMDKMQRIGIRVTDLIDYSILEEKLKFNFEQKKRLIDEDLWNEMPTLEQIIKEYSHMGVLLAPLITDTTDLLNTGIQNGEKILLEGAQGAMLDIDHGTYPFVTSSNPTAGGSSIGSGIGPTNINKVIGVAKAYVSRVGEGPFPTEQLNSIGNKIREKAHEYGTVTNRPRRIGWFDGVMMKYVSEVNGFTDLVINCLDILSGIKTIKICTGYKTADGKIIDYYPASDKLLQAMTPQYLSLPGWSEDITNITSFDALPQNAQNFLKSIEKITKVQISAFSVGADRSKTIKINDLW